MAFAECWMLQHWLCSIPEKKILKKGKSSWKEFTVVVCRNIEEVSQRKQEFSGEANKTMMRVDNRIMIIMRTKTKMDLPTFSFESHLVSSKASPQRAKLDKPDNLPSDSRTPENYLIFTLKFSFLFPSQKIFHINRTAKIFLFWNRDEYIKQAGLSLRARHLLVTTTVIYIMYLL